MRTEEWQKKNPFSHHLLNSFYSCLYPISSTEHTSETVFFFLAAGSVGFSAATSVESFDSTATPSSFDSPGSVPP